VTGPVLLLDGHSLLFRAHHALPPMSTRAGEPTSALYGFSSVLLKLLREHRPSALAIALDAPQKTFRHRQFEGYKGERAGAPDALVRQLARFGDVVRALAVPAHCVPGFEADDVLATLARELRDDGKDALVVSGDRDLLQVARGTTRVLFVGRRGKDAVLYDAAAVEARFGVPSERLPSWVALAGDPSDNLARVPGIGPKTATDLVARYASAAEILAHLDELPEKLADTLRANADQIRTNEDLARLRDDVQLPTPQRAAPITNAALADLATLFEALEFKSLVPRIAALRS
jgi:DNA polymerase-1